MRILSSVSFLCGLMTATESFQWPSPPAAVLFRSSLLRMSAETDANPAAVSSSSDVGLSTSKPLSSKIPLMMSKAREFSEKTGRPWGVLHCSVISNNRLSTQETDGTEGRKVLCMPTTIFLSCTLTTPHHPHHITPHHTTPHHASQ